MCVTRWFCRQEGASSCPCCRRESGTYDDVPRAAGGDDDESVASDEDDNDDESVVSIEEYWIRGADGVWKRAFRETVTGEGWDPVAEPDDVPLALHVGATVLQTLWRGHAVRRDIAVKALLSLKNAIA